MSALPPPTSSRRVSPLVRAGWSRSVSRTAMYVRRFSSEPSITSTSMPVRRRTRSRNASEFWASRTALVATAR